MTMVDEAAAGVNRPPRPAAYIQSNTLQDAAGNWLPCLGELGRHFLDLGPSDRAAAALARRQQRLADYRGSTPDEDFPLLYQREKRVAVCPPASWVPEPHASPDRYTVSDAVDGPLAVCPAGQTQPLEPLDESRWGELLTRVLKEFDPSCPADPAAGPRWLWEGVIPAGELTVLAAAANGGKSTLLRRLLRAADPQAAGAGLLLGRPVLPARAIVFTEEPESVWAAEPWGHVRLVYPAAVGEADIDCRASGWVDRLCRRYAADVVIVDSFSRWYGVDENDPRKVTAALAELRDFAIRTGRAAVLTHHFARQTGTVRGSTAIEAEADVTARLEYVSDDPADTRRRLRVDGRHGIFALTYRRPSGLTLDLVTDPTGEPAARRLDFPPQPPAPAVGRRGRAGKAQAAGG